MKERPILMSAPMVRAILAGTKTQTRRVVKPQPDHDAIITVGEIGTSRGAAYIRYPMEGGITTRLPCPYGQPGDRLFVRENGWERPERTPKMMREGADTWARYYYDAEGLTDQDHEDLKARGFKRRPSIHMPRWASRILLEIVSVRVERLQEINREDAIAEGVRPLDGSNGPNYWTVDAGDVHLNNPTAQGAYSMLWDWINGPDSWELNPWVWVVEFNRMEATQ